MRFEDVAAYCEKTYGSDYNKEEEYFICSDCGEILYKCDQESDYDWTYCPVCEINFYKEGK